MLDKIEDHFILIDKCAGQTRIAEIKDRKLIKYISWFDNNPPQIGNICEATIVKKLNGGVARAKTKDQTILSIRGVPQKIKPHSKVNIIITSDKFDDKKGDKKVIKFVKLIFKSPNSSPNLSPKSSPNLVTHQILCTFHHAIAKAAGQILPSLFKKVPGRTLGVW